jgi:hypothetical protein
MICSENKNDVRALLVNAVVVVHFDIDTVHITRAGIE